MTIGILLISCEDNAKQEKIEEQTPIITENFDWLIGDWQRSNEKEGRETFEIWVKESKTEYRCIGFTIQDNDTISQEKMKVLKTDQAWNLEVIMKEDSKPTSFNVIKIEKGSFVCVNDQNEFPTKIHYWKEGDEIKALVSGGDLEIPFEFVRVEK